MKIQKCGYMGDKIHEFFIKKCSLPKQTSPFDLAKSCMSDEPTEALKKAAT